jgi:O-antigen/teichoic acid export membrane protein
MKTFVRLLRSPTARHGGIVFAGTAVISVFNYLFYMLIGRRVGVGAYGVVTSLSSVLFVIGAPAIVGQLIAARLAADLELRNDRSSIRRLADYVTLLSTAIGIVVFVIGYFARFPVAGFFNLTDPAPVIATLIALALFGVVMIQRGVLQGAHRFTEYVVSGSIETIAKVIAGVWLAGTFGATGALVGIDIGLALALLYNLVIFSTRFGPSGSALAFDAGLVKRVVTNVGVGQLTLTILTFYDVPLVKHLFDPLNAGLFSAAALVGRAVFNAVSFVPTLVLPKAAARMGVGRSPLPLLAAALALAGGIVGFAAVASAIAPQLIVTAIAGPKYGDASSLVLGYVVANGALSLANVVAAYKMGLHRFDFVVPALLLAISEIVTISFWHPSLLAVLAVLAVGHTAVLGATLFRVTAWTTKRSGLADRIVDAVS